MIAYLISTLFLMGSEYKSTQDYMFSKDSILVPKMHGQKQVLPGAEPLFLPMRVIWDCKIFPFC